MIPGAGLYLPGTLHRNESNSQASSERREKSPKYLQSSSRRRVRDARTSDDGASINSSRKPSTDTINSGLSLATDLTSIDTVSSARNSVAPSVIDQLVEDVRADISEASRLYASPAVSNFLNIWPDKRTWVDQTLLAARHALRDDIVGDNDATQKGGDISGKSVSKRTFDWFHSPQKKDFKRQQHIRKCHHELAGAIHIMQTIELCGMTNGTPEKQVFEAPAQPWVSIHEKDASSTFHSAENSSLHQDNAELSISTLSDVGEKCSHCKHQITSYEFITDFCPAVPYLNTEPIELPGSIPEEQNNSPISSSLYSLPDIILADDVGFGRANTLKRSHARSTRRPKNKKDPLSVQLPHRKKQSPLMKEFLEWVALSPTHEQVEKEQVEVCISNGQPDGGSFTEPGSEIHSHELGYI